MSFALKRCGLLYGFTVAVMGVAGAVWAHVDHHQLGFSVAVLLYLGAAGFLVAGTFSQARTRKEYVKLSVVEQRHSFSTQMWLTGIAVAIALTGVAAQAAL